jgi:hypothetical protein
VRVVVRFDEQAERGSLEGDPELVGAALRGGVLLLLLVCFPRSNSSCCASQGQGGGCQTAVVEGSGECQEFRTHQHGNDCDDRVIR